MKIGIFFIIKIVVLHVMILVVVEIASEAVGKLLVACVAVRFISRHEKVDILVRLRDNLWFDYGHGSGNLGLGLMVELQVCLSHGGRVGANLHGVGLEERVKCGVSDDGGWHVDGEGKVLFGKERRGGGREAAGNVALGRDDCRCGGR